jgi:hypothetical protein
MGGEARCLAPSGVGYPPLLGPVPLTRVTTSCAVAALFGSPRSWVTLARELVRWVRYRSAVRLRMRRVVLPDLVSSEVPVCCCGVARPSLPWLDRLSKGLTESVINL